MTSPGWDRAALVVATRDAARRPEIVALGPDLPTVERLFTFMRDAELRFRTLRLRIEERSRTARGELTSVSEVTIEHPGQARIATFDTGAVAAATHGLWLSDGETVRTYLGADRRGTERPIRNRPRGLADRDFPGSSKVYTPLTPLQMESLPELFVHPAGYCQNVLATGRCDVIGVDVVAGREAVVLACDHPRTVEVEADRPDYRIEIAVDRMQGLITRLVETVGGAETRRATVVAIDVDPVLAPDTFAFEFPAGTTIVY